MHRNPVARRLVLEPEQWKWSSSRWYAYGEAGPVWVNEAAADGDEAGRAARLRWIGSIDPHSLKIAKSGATSLDLGVREIETTGWASLPSGKPLSKYRTAL